MSVRKVLGTNPRRMKKDSEQDKIRVIAVDTSTDLASRLTDLVGENKADVRRESSIDRALETFESEPCSIISFGPSDEQTRYSRALPVPLDRPGLLALSRRLY